MPVMELPQVRSAELELALRRQIELQTWGHLRGLHVEVLGDRVTIHGRSASYYVKQRALMAAMEVLSAEPSPPQILLDIDVARDRPRMSEGRDANRRPR